MLSEIYYFTGTGNSLAASRMLNDALSEKSSIISMSKNSAGVKTNADRIGFVFPVYCRDAPDIVKRFIERSVFKNASYIFAIATYNVNSGRCMYSISKLLKKKNKSISASALIAMPGNAKINTVEAERKKLKDSVKQIQEISSVIESKQTIMPAKVSVKERIHSRVIGSLAKRFEFSPKYFKVSDDCVSCGVCAKVCPSSNIVIKDGKPFWESDCTSCLACFHWCPKEAVTQNNRTVMNRRRYRHPDIELKDML